MTTTTTTTATNQIQAQTFEELLAASDAIMTAREEAQELRNKLEHEAREHEAREMLQAELAGVFDSVVAERVRYEGNNGYPKAFLEIDGAKWFVRSPSSQYCEYNGPDYVSDRVRREDFQTALLSAIVRWRKQNAEREAIKATMTAAKAAPRPVPTFPQTLAEDSYSRTVALSITSTYSGVALKTARLNDDGDVILSEIDPRTTTDSDSANAVVCTIGLTGAEMEALMSARGAWQKLLDERRAEHPADPDEIPF